MVYNVRLASSMKFSSIEKSFEYFKLVNSSKILSPNIKVANFSKVPKLSRESILKIKSDKLGVLFNPGKSVERCV
jgi:helix-turn-helix protein